MKLLVINNLASGNTGEGVYEFVRAFAQDGDEVCMRTTDGTTDIAELMADATDFDAVVASGGDGTAAAVNFLLADTGTPVLPFPAGTANLLVNNLALPGEPHALAKVVREGRTLDFDLGRIELPDRQLGFLLIAGAGYDAAIMRGAEPMKPVLGQMAYFSSAAANALTKPSHLTLTLDGQTIERDGMGLLVVNFSQLQYDVSITHVNEPRDGMFDVVVLKAHNAFELIPAVLAALLDRSGDFPDRPESLEIHRAKELRVEADPPLEVQYDGEPTGLTTPFSAHILPHAARLLVSEEGLKAFGAREGEKA